MENKIKEKIESCNLINMVKLTNQQIPSITNNSCLGLYTYDENDKAELWQSCTECIAYKNKSEVYRMNNQITIDFGDIINDLNKNNVRFGFVKTNMNIMCLFDNKKQYIYEIESYYLGSYLDKLIKNNTIVKFNLVENSVIEDWQKEIWNVTDVESFIKRQINS